ncbi:hypothetical protein DFO58_0980 [Arthrobacter sp. AG1021]|uniref:HNH endonuclease signature motif containing protein n=1 Tax=Arthrobacter sp. AG1021 TaxID=2183908 RepID=UPI000EAED4EF|nr:HNH endonuclease signature motif containing protein [Arthrobacter sp. AG1021]RKS22928.1 hypothetical protein DFO58_0980 [Arthrobacter sp. AG1021]
MTTEALLTALHTLCTSPKHLGTQLTAGMLVRLGALCLALFTALGRLVHETRDPRLVLSHAQLVEQFAQQVHREQLAGALEAEVTGAAGLSLATYDALRAGTCDLEVEPEFATGRASYKTAGDLLAAWLGITYFEAQRRIDDAHLLIGRRTAQGTICAPRFEHLASIYAQGQADRRAIAGTARSLEKLEKPDTTFDGVPCSLTARAADGRLLEEHAADALRELGPIEARKQIGTQIKTYKELHEEKLPPDLGLFIGPVVRGVHTFTLRTLAAHAEYLRSVAAQSGSKRTKAGKHARKPDADQAVSPEPPDSPAQQESPAAENEGTASGDQRPTPDWLQPEGPMPDWAAEDPEPSSSADQQPDQESPAGAAADDDGPKPDPDAEPHENDTEEPAAEEPNAPLRRLNALMAILTTSFTGSAAKPIVPKILVYLRLKDLQNLAEAHGISAHGVDIPPGELRKLLVTARVIPLVLGGNSQPLDVGRSRRFHQGYIKMAVMARDRGCIVPECTTPPDLVEIDHYKKPWAEGGTTSVDSGAAMCSNEHHGRHSGQLKVVDVNGLPHVLLPPHLDPEQKPRRNTYWGALQLDDDPPGGAGPPATDPPADRRG